MLKSAPTNEEAITAGESFLSLRFWLPPVLIAIAIALLWWWSNKQSIVVTNIEDENEVLLVLKQRSASETSRERELKIKLQSDPAHRRWTPSAMC